MLVTKCVDMIWICLIEGKVRLRFVSRNNGVIASCLSSSEDLAMLKTCFHRNYVF